MYIVFEYAPSYGCSICNARRFNDSEKARYAEWFQDYGFVGEGGNISLDALRWDDELVKEIRSRKPDGEFCGCNNSAWIITEAEREALIALNAEKENKGKEAERLEEIEELRQIIAKCEAQPELYSREAAAQKRKEYNDIHNEGGEGYVPHYYTTDEYEAAKRRLEELKEVQ